MERGPGHLGQLLWGRERARGTQQQKLEQVKKRRGRGSEWERSEELPGESYQTPLGNPC